jgi:hypothetical protein
MQKSGKCFIPLVIFLILTIIVCLITTPKYKSFEGKIERMKDERYRAEDSFSCFLPLTLEVPYSIKIITIRTKKGEILDLAAYGNEINRESVGKFIKGSYRQGNTLNIKGKNVILGFIDFPGPEIRLRGNPDGVIRKYRIITQ